MNNQIKRRMKKQHATNPMNLRSTDTKNTPPSFPSDKILL
jgi:hypothetical protein